MFIVRLIILIFSFSFICSCGGGEESTGYRDTLARLWLAEQGNHPNLDLSTVLIGTQITISFRDAFDAIQCTCLARFDGDPFRGFYDINCPTSCSGQFQSMNASGGIYSISSESILTLCEVASEPETCVTYF